MSEREPLHGEDVDPYWQVDAEAGELTWADQPHMLRLRAHIAPEPYSRAEGEELVPLSVKRGTRTYVMARAYVLEPVFHLQVQIDPQPDSSRRVGTVRDSRWEGMQDRKVGEGQAWFYPEPDACLVLWECFLEDRFRLDPDPGKDRNHLAWWRGFERFLLGRFPDARLLVTTHADPLFDTEQYQVCLRDLGYRQLSVRAFGKEVGPEASQSDHDTEHQTTSE